MHDKTLQLWSIGLKIHFLEWVQGNTYTKDLQVESNSADKIEWKHPLNMPLARQMHSEEGLKPSLMGGSKQPASGPLVEPAGREAPGQSSASTFIHFQGFTLFLSEFSWNQEINSQCKRVKFHSSMLLTKHGATVVFILQSSRQRELKKLLEKIHQRALLHLFCVIILVWRGIQKRKKIQLLFLRSWQSC